MKLNLCTPDAVDFLDGAQHVLVVDFRRSKDGFLEHSWYWLASCDWGEKPTNVLLVNADDKLLTMLTLRGVQCSTVRLDACQVSLRCIIEAMAND